MNIPLIIDSSKSTNGLVRSSYFTIEGNGSDELWNLNLSNQWIPFILLRLEGIIVGAHFSELEENISSWQLLFDSIEKIDGLSIQLNSLLIPEYFFSESFKRGNVYESSVNFFKYCQDLAKSKSGINERQIDLKELKAEFSYSSSQTESFNSFHKDVIIELDEYYEKNRKKMLKQKG